MVVRRLAGMAVAVGVALMLAGCNDSALTKRELVVYFGDDATSADHAAALHACSNVTPEATPEPFVTSGPAADQVGDVRFRIDHADDKALATLENCLDRQPGVVGADIPDLTD
jgi:hypothetical protein